MTSDLWNNAKTLSGLIGHLVSVTGCSGQQRYKGVLISADPVSKSVVLVKNSADSLPNQDEVLTNDKTKQFSYQLEIIPWVQLESIELHDKFNTNSTNEEAETLKFRKQFLNCLFDDNEGGRFSDIKNVDLEKRKSVVKGHLQKHQLNVREDTNHNLIVHDLVTIVSPFMSANCESTNQIVLDRIRNLIIQLDSSKE
jgi:hypothetical protein